jgi:type III restriction enzyme
VQYKFEANQEYQLEAIRAVVDVFDGQPLAAQGMASLEVGTLEVSTDELFQVTGVPNRLLISSERILQNLRAVQERHSLPISEQLESVTVEGSPGMEGARSPGIDLNFSVEMETGTGKTYVYLRTIYELHAKYGFTKFIITVPSVAIREGVLFSLRQSQAHFAALYGNVPVDHWVYNSRQFSRLRDFATSPDVQIMVINIDAFNKAANNVIFQDKDQLSGVAPIEFVRAVNPIVIVDEPQNFEADSAKRALASLNPLCTLRYSATHRNPYNTVYNLDPVRAYDLGLVKQIEVNSILEEENFNVPHLALVEVKIAKSSIAAKLEMDVFDGKTVKRKVVTVKHGQSVYDLSGKREIYEGYRIEAIDASGFTPVVEFANGVRLEQGQSQGVNPDDLMRVQIRETIREHLVKEDAFSRIPAPERPKVLSLFFIDRVANYRGEDAKIKRFFEEAYQELVALPNFAALGLPSVERVHDGYFAQDAKGNLKDTTGGTQADDEAYEKIMRDKERLLVPKEPLRFIFSHSALREGWDNPNVFQICTLNETKSEVKKRQEIGRGLRLPVRANGERSRDSNINRLTIIANESYKDFAKALQTEIEQDTGVAFGGERVKNARDRRTLILKKGWELSEDFRILWERIRHRTRYRVQFESNALIASAAKAIHEMPVIEAPKYRVEKGRIIASNGELTTELAGARHLEMRDYVPIVPDALAFLQRETELTRAALVRILRDSGRLTDLPKNPQQFLDLALNRLQKTLQQVMVDGIKYEKLNDAYDMMLFESHELESYISNVQDVGKSIYDGIVFQSKTEQEFARNLDKRDDVKLFIKLPGWFKVDTPLGTYNPDWAIVLVDDGLEKLYFVCETKSTTDETVLRNTEQLKVDCGQAHFGTLEVPYVLEAQAVNLTPEKVKRAAQSNGSEQ